MIDSQDYLHTPAQGLWLSLEPLPAGVSSTLILAHKIIELLANLCCGLVAYLLTD